MQRTSASVALMIAVVLGVALELVVTAISGAAEAWDSSTYWAVGYPAAVILCGALGYYSPKNWQAHGPLLLGAQWIIMAIGKTPGPLTLPGLLFAAVLSVPCVVAGFVGAATAGHFRQANDRSPPAQAPP